MPPRFRSPASGCGPTRADPLIDRDWHAHARRQRVAVQHPRRVVGVALLDDDVEVLGPHRRHGVEVASRLVTAYMKSPSRLPTTVPNHRPSKISQAQATSGSNQAKSAKQPADERAGRGADERPAARASSAVSLPVTCSTSSRSRPTIATRSIGNLFLGQVVDGLPRRRGRRRTRRRRAAEAERGRPASAGWCSSGHLRRGHGCCLWLSR